ncbi:sugar phosphate isomerase/epimerase [Thermocatellispora tengchongensis]|uniref:Sugar phosphate isomerase/epimerase n=1 Tax=Thermocatellispora tengchongensis TaxID=1073253 RepID=A0A840P488_9ACTN|nr:sugar phosphate isomerase/epimerase [Thermocatellispora tengchongensis]MBB5132681.1 sugar phosphate isomerase/epimerase [Thermocatellispora tengchongensis]
MGRDFSLDRRGFIAVAGGAAASALVGAWATPAAAQGDDDRGHGSTHDRDFNRDFNRDRGRGRLVPRDRLGIQLFTIRDQVAGAGFAAVFAELERIGYKEVEFAGYTQGSVGPITIAQIKQLLDDHGLRGVGSHVGYHSSNPNAVTFATNLTRVLDEAQALGLPHIGTASSPARYGNTVDAWKRAAAEFNEYGAAAKARGMKFYQHNHGGEFGFATDKPEVRLYDVLLAETDPDLVYLQMDIYWAYVGQYLYSSRPDPNGGPPIPTPFDPLDYVLRNRERYPLFHVKDGVKDTTVPNGYRFADVGDGDIDYQRFIEAVQDRDKRGRRKVRHHYIVERDDAPSNPAGSFSTAERSHDHLTGLRETRH